MIQNEHQAGVSVSAFSQVPFPEDPKPVVTKTFLADGSGRMLIGQLAGTTDMPLEAPIADEVDNGTEPRESVAGGYVPGPDHEIEPGAGLNLVHAIQRHINGDRYHDCMQKCLPRDTESTSSKEVSKPHPSGKTEGQSSTRANGKKNRRDRRRANKKPEQ